MSHQKVSDFSKCHSTYDNSRIAQYQSLAHPTIRRTGGRDANRREDFSARLLPTLAAQAQNEVANPGFETGNFNGWTVEAPSDQYVLVHLSNVSNDQGNGPSHSGNYYAILAGYFVPFDTISQSITTQAGHLYDVSFWLRSNGDSTGSSHNTEFKTSFDGTLLLDDTNRAFTDWQFFSYTGIAATADSALLRFSGSSGDTFWALDDVSVTAEDIAVTPEASSLALFSGPIILSGICFLRRRLRRA